MKYTLDQLEQDMAGFVAGLSALRALKGKEYATQEDTLANYRAEGVAYTVGRASEKIRRLKNLIRQNAAKERLYEEIGDITNIIIYTKILIEQGEYDIKCSPRPTAGNIPPLREAKNEV